MQHQKTCGHGTYDVSAGCLEEGAIVEVMGQEL